MRVYAGASQAECSAFGLISQHYREVNSVLPSTHVLPAVQVYGFERCGDRGTMSSPANRPVRVVARGCYWRFYGAHQAGRIKTSTEVGLELPHPFASSSAPHSFSLYLFGSMAWIDIPRSSFTPAVGSGPYFLCSSWTVEPPSPDFPQYSVASGETYSFQDPQLEGVFVVEPYKRAVSLMPHLLQPHVSKSGPFPTVLRSGSATERGPNSMGMRTTCRA